MTLRFILFPIFQLFPKILSLPIKSTFQPPNAFHSLSWLRVSSRFPLKNLHIACMHECWVRHRERVSYHYKIIIHQRRSPPLLSFRRSYSRRRKEVSYFWRINKTNFSSLFIYGWRKWKFLVLFINKERILQFVIQRRTYAHKIVQAKCVSRIIVLTQ